VCGSPSGGDALARRGSTLRPCASRTGCAGRPSFHGSGSSPAPA
jgi:hypothetical protein